MYTCQTATAVYTCTLQFSMNGDGKYRLVKGVAWLVGGSELMDRSLKGEVGESITTVINIIRYACRNMTYVRTFQKGTLESFKIF